MYVVILSLTDKSFLKWAYDIPKLPQGTKSAGNYWQFVRHGPIYERFGHAFFKNISVYSSTLALADELTL